MYIIELNYPGTWLQFEGQDVKHEIEGMLRSLVGIVTEAAISLSMYEESTSAPRDHRQEMERDRELRQEIDTQLRNDTGDDYYQDFDKYRSFPRDAAPFWLPMQVSARRGSSWSRSWVGR